MLKHLVATCTFKVGLYSASKTKKEDNCAHVYYQSTHISHWIHMSSGARWPLEYLISFHCIKVNGCLIHCYTSQCQPRCIRSNWSCHGPSDSCVQAEIKAVYTCCEDIKSLELLSWGRSSVALGLYWLGCFQDCCTSTVLTLYSENSRQWYTDVRGRGQAALAMTNCPFA